MAVGGKLTKKLQIFFRGIGRIRETRLFASYTERGNITAVTVFDTFFLTHAGYIYFLRYCEKKNVFFSNFELNHVLIGISKIYTAKEFSKSTKKMKFYKFIVEFYKSSKKFVKFEKYFFLQYKKVSAIDQLITNLSFLGQFFVHCSTHRNKTVNLPAKKKKIRTKFITYF